MFRIEENQKFIFSKIRQIEGRSALLANQFFRDIFQEIFKHCEMAVERGVKTGGKNWHAPCRWWERINFFVEYVNTHTQNSLAAERELTNWDKLMH